MLQVNIYWPKVEYKAQFRARCQHNVHLNVTLFYLILST